MNLTRFTTPEAEPTSSTSSSGKVCFKGLSRHATWFVGWVRIALILFVIGVSLAWLGWPMQRAGFWLEAALLMFAGYILGCLIGGALRKLFARLSPVKKGE